MSQLKPLLALLVWCCGCLAVPASAVAQPAALPTPQEMAKALTDVWGEAALRQPGGPSYEFFKDFLPPLRYANTEFRHYPIVLSAPAGAVKARWVSNGGAVNARANKKPMWREVGFPRPSPETAEHVHSRPLVQATVPRLEGL